MPSVRFTAPNAGNSVLESAGSLSHTLALSAPSSQAVSVLVRGTGERASDLDVADRLVTFQPGQTTASFTTAVVNDALYEGDEFYAFEIVDASDAELDRSTADASRFFGFIVDDDRPTLPLVRFAGPNSLFVAENAGSFTHTLALSAASSQPITVVLRGPAAGGADLGIRDQVVTIAPGQVSTTFSVPVYDDRLREGDESFTFGIVSASGAEIDLTTPFERELYVQIMDDDAPLQPVLLDPAVSLGARREYAVSLSAGTGSVSGVSEEYDVQQAPQIKFLDGRLVYDVSDRAAVVYRLYGAAFDRAPDSPGLNGWIAALERGTTVEGMAGFFAGSPEFLATYGALTDRGFVEQLYRNVLDREGDPSGIAFWTGRLEAGALTRGAVLSGFSEAPEHVEKLRPAVGAGLWDANEGAAAVARLYHAALDRAPDAGGLTYWTQALAGGRPLADLADGFAGSTEFGSRYGALSAEGYVRQLYRNVLDREGEADGVAYWTGEIASGRLDRGDVLAGFSNSTEFQIKTLPVIDGGILLA